jgi:hypothetical protein
MADETAAPPKASPVLTFFTTLPGILTGIASAATALTALWAAFLRAPPPAPRQPILVNAVDYANGPDVARAIQDERTAHFGNVIMNRSPPDNARPNWAEWRLDAGPGGQYRLRVEYAAAEPRPVQVRVNDRIVVPQALNATTPCWEARCIEWRDVGTVTLMAGENILKLDRPEGVFPHIRTLQLLPAN